MGSVFVYGSDSSSATIFISVLMQQRWMKCVSIMACRLCPLLVANGCTRNGLRNVYRVKRCFAPAATVPALIAVGCWEAEVNGQRVRVSVFFLIDGLAVLLLSLAPKEEPCFFL